MYQKLWQMQSLKIMKITEMKFINNYVPTNSNRYQRRIRMNTVYPRCGQDFETNRHASRDCPLALQVSQDIGINWSGNQKRDSIVNQARQLFSGSSNQQKLIVKIAIWAIWFSRNKLVNEGKQQSKTKIVTFISGYIRGLELLIGERVEQAIDEIVAWRSPLM